MPRLKLVLALGSLAGLLAFAGPAQADDWKDESGHGRRGFVGPPPWAGRDGGPPPGAGRGGETPAWARGRGYWDGHFKH
ncbi:hypothetical protein, partial [Alienimonas sp. DA493]|uniref:hypothetical protein n=1 Tax=Alienimonas sp. DA493 TaxID=3373605 RepID=UPI00375512E0